MRDMFAGISNTIAEMSRLVKFSMHWNGCCCQIAKQTPRKMGPRLSNEHCDLLKTVAPVIKVASASSMCDSVASFCYQLILARIWR